MVTMHRCTRCSKAYSRPDALQRHRKNACGWSDDIYQDGWNETLQVGKGIDPTFVFKHPFCMMVVGPSQSGKTVWITNLLKERLTRISSSPRHIVYCYSYHQPKYFYLKKLIPDIVFNRGIPEKLLEDDEFEDAIIILDDMMTDVMKDSRIIDLFTKGSHHRKLSVVLVLQNLYHQDKGSRTINLNSQYLVLFKNPRDRQQVETLARQMYPRHWRSFMDTFEKETEQPHSYIILDFHSTTKEKDRIRTGILFDKELPPNNSPEELRKINENLQKLVAKRDTKEDTLIKKMKELWSYTHLSNEEKVRQHTDLLHQLTLLKKNGAISKVIPTEKRSFVPPEGPKTKEEIDTKEFSQQTDELKEEPETKKVKPDDKLKEIPELEDVSMKSEYQWSPPVTRSKKKQRDRRRFLPKKDAERAERQDELNTNKGTRYPSFTDEFEV